MRSTSACLLGTLYLAACQTSERNLPIAETVYSGGQVWNGEGFEISDIAIADGRILESYRNSKLTVETDISGKFLTPALANGHQHITNANLQNTWQFFDVGVYYVWNPNLYSDGLSAESRAFYGRTDTVDVETSLGGVTEPKSHPEPLYVDSLGPYVYNGATFEDLYQKAFHYGRTPEEIVETLDRLSSQGTDFVKIYLLNSEDYSPPDANGDPTGTTGLNPENIAFLVEEAHARGLPVIAHVESRYDVEVCARAGVDFLGHLPGYYGVPMRGVESVRLTDDDARLLAENNVGVIPTYGLGPASFQRKREADPPPSSEALEKLAADEKEGYELQAENLIRLKSFGVQIMVGTDLFPGRALDEPSHWISIGAMSPIEALSAMFATGPALFDDRRIGCLDAGCEADFLVLDDNPIDDLAAFTRIARWVKGGQELMRPDPPKPVADIEEPTEE
ncbi:MAG: amidohydrolase family protein [Pseudomonadota bacterium]